MIDLGLSKMAVIGVVALIAIGPEKLPKVARMAGSLFGRAQRYLNQVKAEVSREIELEELRRVQQEVQQAASSLEQQVNQELHTVSDSMQPWADPLTTPDVAADVPVALDPHKRARFRQRKLAHTQALPNWYKKRHGVRQHVRSGAARMARHRAVPLSRHSFF